MDVRGNLPQFTFLHNIQLGGGRNCTSTLERAVLSATGSRFGGSFLQP
jgi:hypothetical protein